MHVNKLLRFATTFHSLATGEKLPPDSKDLSTVLKNLAALETYTARKDYAEKNLEHLSSGSSRIVYLTPKKTIVKVSKNDKGVEQNKTEANPKMTSRFLNKILSHADNYAWIETHYLDKISVKDFKEMTGLDFEEFGDAIRYGLKNVSENTDIEKPKNFGKVEKSDIYKELYRIGQAWELMPGDLARISSWGEKDDHPILIDSGLTKKIFKNFYEDSSS
jgi:hypothetical protein